MIAWLTALVAALTLGTASPTTPTDSAPPAAREGVPSKAQWLDDVHRVLAGAPDDLRARVQRADDGAQLALNLDIDNTSIASSFGGGPMRDTLHLTRVAQRQGVAVLFNTARDEHHRARTLAQLKAAGYHVDGLCMRHTGEQKAHSKQRCRAHFADEGYTLIANLGNNATDFEGHGYERAYRLPNYGGLLP